MPQITSTLPEHLIDTLNDLAKSTGKSFSKLVCELIELGLKLYDKQEQNTSTKEQELEAKHTEYLLRNMAICADILRCVRNEKSKYNDIKDTEEVLKTIAAKTQSYINSGAKNT